LKGFVLKTLLIVFSAMILINLFADSLSSFIKDDEYLINQHKKNVLNGKYKLKFDPEVLILGDCLALNNFPNTLLHEKSYNLALPGMTPFEAYFHSKKFIKRYPTIKKVVYLVSGAHFVEQGQIYSMSLLNGLLDFHEVQQLADDFEKYNYAYQALDYEKGLFYNLLSSKSRLYLDYLYVPLGRTFNNFRFFKRCFSDNCFFKDKRNFVKDTINGKGHYFYEDQTGLVGPYKNIKRWSSFNPQPLVTHYFKKNIMFFKNKKIEVSIIQSPISQISYDSLKEGFYFDFQKYFENIQKELPEVYINNQIKVYSNDMFSTDVYLKQEAANKFVLSVKKMMNHEKL
jgi:hypothetical protein